MSAAPDSQMLTDDSEVATPQEQVTRQPLSPPDSQLRDPPAMPASASGTSIANSNGKRPLGTITNGADDAEELQAMANGKARTDTAQVRTHPSSGYQYSKEEDAPGYAWLNKKAQDEAVRAWDNLSHKDSVVKGKFGDIFKMTQEEQIMAASPKQS